MTHAIERYLIVRQAYRPILTTEGNNPALLANMTDVPQVWQVPIPAQDDLIL